MTDAKEIKTLIKTKIHSRPVRIRDIYQSNLRILTSPLDCYVAGNMVRISTQTAAINVGSRGMGANSGRLSIHGSLTADLYTLCLDGKTRILPAGSDVEIIQGS